MVKVVAEIGWNFMGDMSLAERMISDAKSCGADIAKFQFWQERKLKPGPWDSDGRREIYKSAQLSEEDITSLKAMCANAGIEFLISVFNEDDAKKMKSLGIDTLKIPSHEVANVRLHEFASQNFQTVYVSLGAGSWDEMNRAAEIYLKSSVDWCAMHCVSTYPCKPENVNLNKIKSFNWTDNTGFSDHTSSTVIPAIAVTYGVQAIEKHFTSDNELPGRDNKFALNPAKFSEMVSNIREAELAMIDSGLELQDVEADTANNYRGRWG